MSFNHLNLHRQLFYNFKVLLQHAFIICHYFRYLFKFYVNGYAWWQNLASKLFKTYCSPDSAQYTYS